METIHDGPLTWEEMRELSNCINDRKPWRGYIVEFIAPVMVYPDYAIKSITVKGRKVEG